MVTDIYMLVILIYALIGILLYALYHLRKKAISRIESISYQNILTNFYMEKLLKEVERRNIKLENHQIEALKSEISTLVSLGTPVDVKKIVDDLEKGGKK